MCFGAQLNFRFPVWLQKKVSYQCSFITHKPQSSLFSLGVIMMNEYYTAFIQSLLCACSFTSHRTWLVIPCPISMQELATIMWPSGVAQEFEVVFFFWAWGRGACSALHRSRLTRPRFCHLISIAFSVRDILFARFSVVNRTPWKNI